MYEQQKKIKGKGDVEYMYMFKIWRIGDKIEQKSKKQKIWI